MGRKKHYMHLLLHCICILLHNICILFSMLFGSHTWKIAILFVGKNDVCVICTLLEKYTYSNLNLDYISKKAFLWHFISNEPLETWILKNFIFRCAAGSGRAACLLCIKSLSCMAALKWQLLFLIHSHVVPQIMGGQLFKEPFKKMSVSPPGIIIHFMEIVAYVSVQKNKRTQTTQKWLQFGEASME